MVDGARLGGARVAKLQTQIYVNRRHGVLAKKVLEALPALNVRNPEFEWVVPLENPPGGKKAFAEPRDGTMLRALKLDHLAPELSKFWPARGPVWDALAILHFDHGTRGALLAEGKNYPREMYGRGTGAGKSGSTAAAASRRQIELAIAWTQGRLGVGLDVACWLDSLDPKRRGSSLYQTANRLAYVVWLRSQGVDAWLCHLLFLDDPLHQPTSQLDWVKGLAEAEQKLRIDGLDLPFAGHAYLPALDAAEVLGEASSFPSVAVSDRREE